MTDLEIVLSLASIMLVIYAAMKRNDAKRWRDMHGKLADEWNRATLKRHAESTRSHGKGWVTRQQRKRMERDRKMAMEFGEFTGNGKGE
jgi:preprotein translocase subunit YajC